MFFPYVYKSAPYYIEYSASLINTYTIYNLFFINAMKNMLKDLLRIASMLARIIIYNSVKNLQ